METQKNQTPMTLFHSPDFQFDEETQEELSEILYRYGLVNEPENPTIVCAWTATDHSGQKMDVVLYLDGGDGEEGGLLFYRCTHEPSDARQEAVSVPGTGQQAMLRKFCSLHNRSERQPLYEQATQVAQDMLLDPSVWISL